MNLLSLDKSITSRHIANFFAEDELERSAVVAEFATTATDGKSFLDADELKRPNTLVSGYFDTAKFRSQQDALPSDVEAVHLETVKAVQKKIGGKEKP
ncbi:MAG: hypothetical protein AAB211_07910 [Pseudomonadota bacterium]